MGRVEGKVALITGAASGIGRATALTLAKEGAAVVVVDLDEAGATETVERLRAAGGTGDWIAADVGASADVEAAVAFAVKSFGTLDILHNNAYWAPLYRALLDTSDEEWEKTLRVTATGVFYGCRYALPVMIKQHRGVIVNTASTSALVASPKFAAYHAAKGAVVSLTRSIAFDYGPDGIRCNAVCPGLVETPATATIFADDARRQWLTEKILVGRHGQPEDIADAVLYLASDESAYVTGQTLVVDGGRMIS